MPYDKDTRAHNEKYLTWLREQPCCICRTNLGIDAHHPRTDSVGMGTKVSDRWAVPLCRRHHDELHATGNEREWWASYGVNPQQIALRYQVKVST